MTGLKKSSEEVGGMEFVAVQELLEYWLEYPPEHLLMRAFVGYKGSGKTHRAQRAEEMEDTSYRPPEEPSVSEAEKDARIKTEFLKSTGARHLDCAPGHVQQAIERARKGKHFDIPKPPEE